eukprot:39334-Pyramimonas_sp.AAC.1
MSDSKSDDDEGPPFFLEPLLVLSVFSTPSPLPNLCKALRARPSRAGCAETAALGGGGNTLSAVAQKVEPQSPRNLTADRELSSTG